MGNRSLPAATRADGGKGGGFVNVTQTIPVIGGKRYTLCLHLRAAGLVPEKKEAGPGLRGL